MAGIRVGGLASGLDSETLITQLMSLSRQPRARMELRERFFETRETALGDVSTRLKNLKTAALDLASASAWTSTQTTTSSDATRVAARQLGGAAPGGYTVEVLSLARAEQHSLSFASNAGATDFSVTQGGATTTYSLAAGASVRDTAAVVNATAGSPVTAVVVNDNGTDRLVLTSRNTGADPASGFTVDVGTSGLGGETVAAGQAATYKLNGSSTVLSSETNVVNSAVPGVELTFKAITQSGAPVSVAVTQPGTDPEAVKAKVKAFVSQYNSTVSFIRGKLAEEKVAQPSTSTEAAKGALRSDAALSDLLSQLRSTVFEDLSATNPAALDQLSELGITTGQATGAASSADSLAGVLTLDEAKLTAALSSDPLSVRRLLGAEDGTSGFAQRIDGLIDPYTRAGGTLSQRASEADSQAQRLRDSMTRLDTKLELEEARLRKQFASLETLLSRSQSQQSWLTGQLGALNR